jgi:hypothetical protein
MESRRPVCLSIPPHVSCQDLAGRVLFLYANSQKMCIIVRFEVFTAVTMKNGVFNAMWLL